MIIAIDGPAGTGKTTVAKRVAECLHFSYFDTGAMYRAVAWVVLQKGIDLRDEAKMQELLRGFSFSIKELGKEKHYYLDDQDITEETRSKRVTSIVSAVSSLPIVRQSLWRIQREFGAKKNAVFEGRDLGTVVFPEAEIKIFLTARPEIRAERRLQEIIAKNPKEAEHMDHEQMLKDHMYRDELDSTRALAPLKQAPDAYYIDTSDLTIDEVVEKILAYKLTKYP
jgi:cytidylate kinase